MTDFFSQLCCSHGQDGTGRSHHASHSSSSTGERHLQHFSPNFGRIQHQKGYAPQASSSSSSPDKAKHKPHPCTNSAPEVSDASICLVGTRELQDSIMEFPTNNQSVLNTTLKIMLVSLRSTIHSDKLSWAQQFMADITDVRDRVTHVEDKMGEFATTFNKFIDAHNGQENDISWMK